VIYRLLGKTGLRVSPLALGTMTFGQNGWGADQGTARAIFTSYLDSGGNFVDTANGYADGRGEELLGTFIAETRSRDRVVLATKFTSTTEPGNPNAVGNGRKNMLASLDASLRRLRTDYIDLYWMHLWDTVTPVEEVLATFDALVRAGKVRAVGLSDVPAWYLAKAQVLAAGRGWAPVAAVQLEYSLVERHIEHEHVPAAADLGVGVVPWSPLASGFLTGKYARGTGADVAGAGRLEALAGAPFLRRRTEQDWGVLDTLTKIAAELGRSPAQVAINWVTRQHGVVSTLVGARTVEQLTTNLAALEVELTAEQSQRLDAAGRPDLHHPYNLFDPEWIRTLQTPGYEVRAFR
jgi:aryl-alcohol dehydrogenase-like predicted oxidoreductase